MAKRKINDIVPPNKRSIRNVAPSDTPKRNSRQQQSAEPEAGQNSRPPKPPARTRLPRTAKYGIWVCTFIALIVLGFAFSLLFSGVTVTVVPKQEIAFIDGEFTAARETGANVVPFETMRFSETVSREVAAQGTEATEERASGKIVVYNDYSSEEQRLITNTRFRSPEGLIYRISEPVVVPGQQTNANGETVPGSIEVTVYADEPGERYNIDRTDFTIPGFEGGPRFDHFYARSKTKMTGGFVGERLTVDEETRDQTRDALQQELREKLLSEAASQKPEEFLLFEEAVVVTFEPLPQEEADEDTARIREEGTLTAALFKQQDIAQLVAENAVAAYDGGAVNLLDPESLTFSLTNPDAYDPQSQDTFTFGLSGETTVVWEYDPEQLKQDLAGKSKDALPTIISGYPGIDHVEKAVIRPFWRQSFPEEPDEIHIKEELDAGGSS